MTADVPDDDGNLTVPLRDNHEADVELLTGGFGPAYARFHAPDWHGTPGAMLALDEFALVAKATEPQLAHYRDAFLTWREEQSRRMYSVDIVREWDPLLDRAKDRCDRSDDGSALISLVFCHPKSVVLSDLKAEYAYFNQRSGATWDLYFVGYDCPTSRYPLPPSVAGIPLWRFYAGAFDNMREHLQRKHAEALAQPDAPFVGAGWRYSGRPEMVSFMAYRDLPGVIDWLSLRAVRLVDATGNYLDRSLSEIVEVMSDWREIDNDDIRDLAPGEPPIVVSARPIERALRATAVAIASGIAGNASYELIKAVVT